MKFGIYLLMTAARDGKPVFRIAIGRRLHIGGWPAILLAPIAIPIVILSLLCQRLLNLKSTTDLTRNDVENYLSDFIDGRGGEWDWDDFTSIPITDPALDAIREQAVDVDLPLDDHGRTILRELLKQVRMM